MMADNGKEQAFPHSAMIGEHTMTTQHGLTKRDYFAVKAMAGILANDEAMRQLMRSSDGGNIDRSAIRCVAERSCQYADALLAALEK